LIEQKNHIVIIHFRPLDGYPPIQNLLKIFAKKENVKLSVFSTVSSKSGRDFSIENSEIHWSDTFIGYQNRFVRLFAGYLLFYIKCFTFLLLKRPKKIIYFESISALPCLMYKWIFKQKELFVHYHEYTTKDEYATGMFIERLSHSVEKKMYDSFKWISHTNKERLAFFANDCNIKNDQILRVMPNYPMSDWNKVKSETIQVPTGKNCLRFIYVGPINFEDTYVKEMCIYIGSRPEATLEIVSNRIPQYFLDFIHRNNYTNITLLGEVKNSDLPHLLQSNKIGLILYKCKTQNQIYAQPNKLFEYLRVGLDVWFPKEMIGCYEFQSLENTKVVCIDFNNIEISEKNYLPVFNDSMNFSHDYTAENATSELMKSLRLYNGK
jgi:hypothetical protein